jgi:hypothetical protein
MVSTYRSLTAVIVLEYVRAEERAVSYCIVLTKLSASAVVSAATPTRGTSHFV